MPGEDIRKSCDSTSNTRWCQFCTKDMKCRMVPNWDARWCQIGMPGSAKLGQACAKISVVRFKSQISDVAHKNDVHPLV